MRLALWTSKNNPSVTADVQVESDQLGNAVIFVKHSSAPNRVRLANCGM